MSKYMNPIKSVSINFENEPLLTIHCDGRVTNNDRLKPTETAALVLDQIKTQWMKDSQATKIRELQDRINRLEEAGDALASAWDKEWLTDADIEAIIDGWHGAKEAKP